MSGKNLFDATEYIGADLIHRAEFANVPKSHWKQVLGTAAIFLILLGAGLAARHTFVPPAPVVPTPPEISDPQPPTVPTEPEVQMPSFQLVTDDRYGVTMAVPEPLQDKLVITPPFSFTLNRPVEEPTLEDHLWFLEIAARSDGQSPDEISNWGLWHEDFKLGWDDTYFYLLHVPPLTEVEEETRTSLLLGFQVLRDFLERNDITPNPNWETAYLRHIPNFWTQPFDSTMDTTQADDALLAYSSQIPNLEYYVWDNFEPVLTWEDLLVYRLATADFTQVTDDPEGLQQFIFSQVLPYSEEGYDGGNPDIPDQFRRILDSLHQYHLWLRMQENLPDMCREEPWQMDKTWVLHCGETEIRLPARSHYYVPDGCMVRDDMEIASVLLLFTPDTEKGPVYHELQIPLTNRQIQEMKTLFEEAELTTVLKPELQELPEQCNFSFYIRYADNSESGLYTARADSGIFYRNIAGSEPDVETGYLRAVNPALIPWMEDLVQQTYRGLYWQP